MNVHTIKIGTRESALATWQAQQVQSLLTASGYKTELVFIKSAGDKDVTTPLYEMGVQGIFTKTLDSALLEKKIDLAIHALKDVPTQAAQGLQQAAVLKRDSYKDILVFKNSTNFLQNPDYQAIIATGSIRRQAQWLNRYPHHRFENLRGNVNTRLKKLLENAWDGAIFAAAGLERLNMRPENSLDLDWMLPAPAQGTIAVYCRAKDKALINICHTFNDAETALCTSLERQFLRTLQGGCSLPIAALALVEKEILYFKGNILSPDGKIKIEIEKQMPVEAVKNNGQTWALELLNKNPFMKNDTSRSIQL